MGTEPSNVVIITGSGEAPGLPDIAQITLGVEQRSQQAKQAITFVDQTMQSVIRALQAAGVERRDLQTSQVSVNLEESPPLPPPPAPIAAPPPVEATKAPEKPVGHAKGVPNRTQLVMTPPEPAAVAPVPEFVPGSPAHATTYRASLFVTVKIRNLQRAGETLAAAFAAGANASFGMNLTWENPNPWFDKARLAAIEDAKHRARELSRIDNLELDRVVSISEQSCGAIATGPQWVGYGVQPAPMMSTIPNVPFERGELIAHCAVRVAYAIKR
jgi:uncharacterized protein YggE